VVGGDAAGATTENATGTADDEGALGRGGRACRPGLVLLSVAGDARVRVFPIEAEGLVVGRTTAGEGIADAKLSREHARVSFDGARFRVEDLGSKNGTFVDGVSVSGASTFDAAKVLRFASTIGIVVRDVLAFSRALLNVDGELVAGEAAANALRDAERIAARGGSILLRGESGTGKEVFAARFRRASRHASGPFVPVNCAAIGPGLAERLLFGAVKGAFSGATDAVGYLRAADGGVLFLDEIGELELDVQAKLLRALETFEVTPLGATHGRVVRFQACYATHRDLRARVAEERFRADLYYRIAEPSVRVPPLRERTEEIPFHIARQLRGEFAGLRPHPAFVEACMLRPWPGNVRELLREVRAACDRALREEAGVVRAEHLAASAGMPIAAPPSVSPPPSADPNADAPAEDPEALAADARRKRIEAALASVGGNVAAAARKLGMHRTQLYRELQKLGK
jgi:DNA-binding NtrC family response regulator